MNSIDDDSFSNETNNKYTTDLDEKYVHYYSNEGLWNKIKKHYKRVGKKLIGLIMTLFYTLRDNDTPVWAKTIILGALGYFILPVDIIPDFVPVVGFTDDFASITLALGAVALHIKKEHKEKARKNLDKYFNNLV